MCSLDSNAVSVVEILQTKRQQIRKHDHKVPTNNQNEIFPTQTNASVENKNIIFQFLTKDNSKYKGKRRQ